MFEAQSQEGTITKKNYFYSDWLAWLAGQTRGEEGEGKETGSDIPRDKLSRKEKQKQNEKSDRINQ